MKRIYTTINKKGNLNDISKEELLKIEDITGGGTTGDYIPLSGTEEGKPVTGPIETSNTSIVSMYSGVNPFSEDYTGEGASAYLIANQDIGVLLGYKTYIEGIGTVDVGMGCDDGPYSGLVTGISTQLNKDSNGKNKRIDYRFNELGIGVLDSIDEVGLVGHSYYGENYTDNTYVQKKYVDDANSYSTTEIKTGGTWIDGKPIYRKVFTDLDFDMALDEPIDVSELNIEHVVDISGTLVRDNVFKSSIHNTIPIFNGSSSFVGIFIPIIGISNGLLIYKYNVVYDFSGSESNVNVTEINVILEYTKTTD